MLFILQNNRILTLCLLLNTLFVLVYLCFHLVLKKRLNADRRAGYLARSLVMFLCPVVGPVMYFVGYFMYRFMFRKEADLSMVFVGKGKFELTTSPDEETEKNIIPFEEALAINTEDVVRSLMMESMQTEHQIVLAKIKEALRSDDSEVSHYAASILQKNVDSFLQKVHEDFQKLQSLYRDPEEEETEEERLHREKLRTEAVKMFLEYTDDFLNQKVITNLEQKDITALMEQIASTEQSEGNGLTAELMEMMVIRHIDNGEYELCENWCRHLEREYPDTLQTYTGKLRYAYAIRDREMFADCMKRLKTSDIPIDADTLGMIRLFTVSEGQA